MNLIESSAESLRDIAGEETEADLQPSDYFTDSMFQKCSPLMPINAIFAILKPRSTTSAAIKGSIISNKSEMMPRLSRD
jgi:hypothetical protein